MIDKVWARTHFRRGTKGGRDLRWDSVGNSGVLSGVLGVTSIRMTERLIHLAGCTSPGVPRSV